MMNTNIHPDILESVNHARRYPSSVTFLAVSISTLPRFVLDRPHAEFIVSLLREAPQIVGLGLNCNVVLDEEEGFSALNVLQDYFDDEASMHLKTIRVTGATAQHDEDGSLLKALLLVLPNAQRHGKKRPDCSLKTIHFNHVDFTNSRNYQSLLALLHQQTFWQTMVFGFCQFRLRDASGLMDGLNFQTTSQQGGSLRVLEVGMCTFAAPTGGEARVQQQEQAQQALSSFLTAKDCKLQRIGIGHVGGDWLMRRWEEHVWSVLRHSNLSLQQVSLEILMVGTNTNASSDNEARPYLLRNVLIGHVQKSLLLSSSSSSSGFWAEGLVRLCHHDRTPTYMVLRALVPKLVGDD